MEQFFLLADDDHDDAQLFGEALEEIDPAVEFHHVGDGSALFPFLDGLGDKMPSIIFLDLNMPEVSGWECLTRLKNSNSYKDIPVILYSTSDIARDKKRALELGAVGLLTKPANYKTLVEILRTIIQEGPRLSLPA